MSIVQNPDLASNFHWEPQRNYRFDGNLKEWVHFIDEPWTATEMWNIQVIQYFILSKYQTVQFQDKLPKGATPLCFSLYADKDRLSTFGTKKGYPVVARLAQLDEHVRNGTGLGGGTIVGTLVVVLYFD